MDVEMPDRPKSIERLLTREQIAELTDLEWLEDELDTVSATAKSIEVDLEFRSDDLATDEWEHRARKALAAHHICQGHLTRRINALRRGNKPVVQQPNHDAKARKKEAEAQRLTAAADHKRAMAAQEREKTVRMMLAYSGRQSLLAHFMAVVREEADRDTFARWMREAHARLDGTLLADHPEPTITKEPNQ